MTVFEAYITNLGKYAEGQLVGETLKFPATTEEVQSLLKNIGVDGVLYEEFFITAFDGDVMGLYDYLTEYENLDELNHLAHLISELDSDEIETLEAALNKGDHTSSVEDIINLVHNLDCYDLHPGVTDDETLGRIYVEDMELLDVPDNVLPYFDFEAYGRDMRINEGGHFAPTGYLTHSGDFKEVYHGIEDIPAEHRIFAYSPIEETDYFTYDEFSAWIENETENIQKLVDAGEWTEAEATEALEYYDEILKSILEGKMVGKRASSSDDQLFFSMPDNAQPEQYQTFVFDGNTYKSIGPFDTEEELFNALKEYTDTEVEAGTMSQAEATALLEKYQ